MNKTSTPIRYLVVNAYLNLYGLTPYQMRLLAHIARRSQNEPCTSSLDKMAIVCKMGVRTAQKALDELVENGMVAKTKRSNKTSLIRVVHDVEKWAEPKEVWEDSPLKEELLHERKGFRQTAITAQKSFFVDKGKPLKAIFAHGYLDMYGLDPYEFRVFSYIFCIESRFSETEFSNTVEKMATICKMSPRKFQTTSKKLDELNFITRTLNDGRASTYQPNSIDKWQEPTLDWSNQRAIARLKNKSESVSDIHTSSNSLKIYQESLVKYYQELEREFAQIKASMKEKLTSVAPRILS